MVFVCSSYICVPVFVVLVVLVCSSPPSSISCCFFAEAFLAMGRCKGADEEQSLRKIKGLV